MPDTPRPPRSGRPPAASGFTLRHTKSNRFGTVLKCQNWTTKPDPNSFDRQPATPRLFCSTPVARSLAPVALCFACLPLLHVHVSGQRRREQRTPLWRRCRPTKYSMRLPACPLLVSIESSDLGNCRPINDVSEQSTHPPVSRPVPPPLPLQLCNQNSLITTVGRRESRYMLQCF